MAFLLFVVSIDELCAVVNAENLDPIPFLISLSDSMMPYHMTCSHQSVLCPTFPETFPFRITSSFRTGLSVFCPGFQKGRVPSEEGTFSAVNGTSKGHNQRGERKKKGTISVVNGTKRGLLTQ